MCYIDQSLLLSFLKFQSFNYMLLVAKLFGIQGGMKIQGELSRGIFQIVKWF